MSIPNANLTVSFDLRAYQESVVKIQECLGQIASLATRTSFEIPDDDMIAKLVDKARAKFSRLEEVAIRMRANIAVTRRNKTVQARLVADYNELRETIIQLPATKGTILGKYRREMMDALGQIEERWKIATDVPAQPESVRFSFF